MIQIAHPFGNTNFYNATLGLYEIGILGRMHTCLFGKLGKCKRYDPRLANVAKSLYPHWEAIRLATTVLPWAPFSGRSQRSVDTVGRWFDRSVARNIKQSPGDVYCYEDFGLETMKTAKDAGFRCFYELPIGFFQESQKVFTEELRREPTLAPFLTMLHESEAKIQRKLAEIQIADLVICPSSFVRQTVLSYLPQMDNIRVVPYGLDSAQGAKQWSSSDFERPLRLLFAGVLGPRKGLHRLFEALSGISTAEWSLTLAGRWVPGFRNWIDRRFPLPYEYLGQVPHSELPALYRRSDIFVLPSLFEGLALVVLEAMACGLPVLTTFSSGLSDLIEDGRQGFLLESPDPMAIRDCIRQAMTNREILPTFGAAAREIAHRNAWEAYRHRLAAAILDITGE